MLSFLFIDSELKWRGGQAQLLTLLEGLHERGHAINLVCRPRTELGIRARALGIPVHPVQIRSEAGLFALVRLHFLFRKIRPDILAFNTPKPILIGNLASRLAPVGSRIIFRRVVFPLRGNFLSRMKYTRGIDCVIAISRSIKAQLLNDGVPESLLRIIYEGIELTPYPERSGPKTRIPGEPVTVGTLSHLSPEKGLRYLIEAASLIPDARQKLRFVVAGDGVCRRELEELVNKKELGSCFRFLGFRTDISELMQGFDLFVLPSLSEGLSSAIMEAMASYLPVIGSDVGSIPELVRDGETGLLVPPASAEKLAAAIKKLADDPETSRRMGLNGRKRIKEKFVLERKILETERLCHELVKKRQIPSGHAYV